MKKSMSVTIAVPAFNEEGNIEVLIKSILNQYIDRVVIEKILIVSDGSTDQTKQVVRKLMRKHKSIQLMCHKNRKGKVYRLNEIYHLNRSDYLIIFDGDILLADEFVVSSMVETMQSNPRVTLLAAHQIPTLSKTFVGKAIYAAYRVWDEARLSVPKQDHIQNFYGAASIYRQSFVKKLQIPSDITDERGYIYLKSVSLGEFKYSYRAMIYYRPVETLHDLWKLGDRSFSMNQKALVKYFGVNIYDLYKIPLKYKLRSILHNLYISPLYTSLGLFLNILIRLFPAHDLLYKSGMWEPSISTKKAITI